MFPGSEHEGTPYEPIYRLTPEQFRRMGEAGILTPDDRVELLEGRVVEKMTKNPPHRIATRKVRVWLETVVPLGWYVDSQEPIVTSDSEPEPDVAVIRGRSEDYADANPGCEHVGLVVEIADVTLLRDRLLKGRLYARARIPTYWLVNLVDRQLEIFEEPASPESGPCYLRHTVFTPDQQVGISLDGKHLGQVRVADLLP